MRSRIDRGRLLLDRPRRGAGAGRRERLGQERDGAVADAAARRRPLDRRAARSCSTPATAFAPTSRRSARSGKAIEAIRGAHMGMIFQEPMSSFSPVHTIGAQIAEVVQVHERRPARRGARDRAADAPRQGRHPDPDRRARPLSVGVLRRHAPARDDRPRADLRPEPAHRRRADDRARRHHPGADPRPAALAEARARHGDPVHHPRPRHRRADGRPRGDHVCRPHRRERAGARHLPPPGASLHARAARSRAAARRHRPTAAASSRSPAPCPTSSRRRPAAASIRAARSPSCRAARRRLPPVFAHRRPCGRLHPRRGERSA